MGCILFVYADAAATDGLPDRLEARDIFDLQGFLG
jgi:hypothetical protein